MMKKLFIISLLISLGVILFLCLSRKEVAEQPTKTKRNEKETAPRVSLEKFHLIETIQGQPQWELRARDARIKETNTELEQLEFIFFTKTKETGLLVEADSGSINRETKDLEIKGKVKATTQDGAVLTTKNLDWQPETSRLITKDKIVLCQEDIKFSGKGMEINPESQVVEIKKDVRIEQTSDSPILIEADKAIWDKKQEITILTGHVNITKGKLKISAEQIKILGEVGKLKQVEGRGEVELVDEEKNICLQGGEISYEHQKAYLLVTQQPRLFIKNQKAEITASKMEAFLQKKKFIASGQVHITHQNTKASASLATYYDDEKKVVLTGNPQVIQDKTKLSGQEIIYYLENERIEVHKGVRATVSE